MSDDDHNRDVGNCDKIDDLVRNPNGTTMLMLAKVVLVASAHCSCSSYR